MSSFHIRPADEKDVDSILQLIKDLATYEKDPDAVKATPELLHDNLFNKQYAHTLLAFSTVEESQNHAQAIGMALYFFNFSTWTGRPGLYLEDLFVKPEYRNKGLGKLFFAELGKVAEEKNCGRMDWSVLTWNQPSIDFYEKVLGAQEMSEWRIMRLEGGGIGNLRRFSNPRA